MTDTFPGFRRPWPATILVTALLALAHGPAAAQVVPGESEPGTAAEAGATADAATPEVLEILHARARADRRAPLEDRAVREMLDLAVSLWARSDFPLDAFSGWIGDACEVVVVTDGPPGRVARVLAERLRLVAGSDEVRVVEGQPGSELTAAEGDHRTFFVLQPAWIGGEVRVASVAPSSVHVPVFADLSGTETAPGSGTLLVGTPLAVGYAARFSTRASAVGELPDGSAIARALDLDASAIIWDRFVAGR